MMSENIKIYKKTEEGYPKTLLQLPDAPSRLYVLGELPDPIRPAIAIVGARNCSSYGKNMAYEYARVLTKKGIQVISGLARGVDAAAHAGARPRREPDSRLRQSRLGSDGRRRRARAPDGKGALCGRRIDRSHRRGRAHAPEQERQRS